MTTYCFRCRLCGATSTSPDRDAIPDHACPGVYARDYAAEGFGVGVGVRVSKTGTERDQADLFLPHARDYASSEDPTGAKGLTAWNEQHGPRPGNKKPKRPEMPLHSKGVL